MNLTDNYGPNNPRPMDPNDPILKSPHGPHEPRAELRMQKNGMYGAQLIKLAGIPGTELVEVLADAMRESDAAEAAGRDLHVFLKGV